jgi:diguanylate cyclase (GGDEF)-like protein
MSRPSKNTSKHPESVLKKIEIFSDLCDEDLKLVFGHMRHASYSQGEPLFNEGDPGDELFVILSGLVAITVKLPEGNELLLSEIGAGNFFGEMSIIEQNTRSASCKTKEPTECLILHADDFNALISDFPEAASRILKRMLAITTGRLINTGSFLTQMVQWGDASRKRAVTDPATGLFNRRYMDDSFDSLVTRAKIDGTPITFVMFDMDRFGSLNAKYGLEFGDKVIVVAAEVFKKSFRDIDILVRYGGDEFIFILPNADTPTAQQLCDGLCAAMREVRFPEHEELRITCSMGFATIPDNAQTTDELKERADKALYKAKELGRDRALGFSE